MGKLYGCSMNGSVMPNLEHPYIWHTDGKRWFDAKWKAIAAIATHPSVQAATTVNVIEIDSGLVDHQFVDVPEYVDEVAHVVIPLDYIPDYVTPNMKPHYYGHGKEINAHLPEPVEERPDTLL